jgi:hypothetical protein
LRFRKIRIFFSKGLDKKFRNTEILPDGQITPAAHVIPAANPPFVAIQLSRFDCGTGKLEVDDSKGLTLCRLSSVPCSAPARKPGAQTIACSEAGTESDE